MDRRHNRPAGSMRRDEEIEAVFDILFVDVDDVGVERPELTRDLPNLAARQHRPQAPELPVIRIAVTNPADRAEFGKLRRQFVHPRVLGQNGLDIVTERLQSLREPAEVELATATRSGRRGDERHAKRPRLGHFGP
jgi:hypothetical protein